MPEPNVFPQIFGPSGATLALNRNNQGQLQYPILTFITTTTPFPALNDTDKFRPSGFYWLQSSGNLNNLVALSSGVYSSGTPSYSGIINFIRSSGLFYPMPSGVGALLITSGNMITTSGSFGTSLIQRFASTSSNPTSGRRTKNPNSGTERNP